MIVVGARASKLSLAQVREVEDELGVQFEVKSIQSKGDLDQKTSLRELDKSDFFTKEIDEMLLRGECQIAIHSAKDLPDPLAEGLEVIKVTKGLDPSDVLVFNGNLEDVKRVGTSSKRREALFPNIECIDIRGTIEKRLELLDSGVVDGVVMAEAALIRLGIDRQRVRLVCETAPLQGRLAIVARKGDEEMRCLVSTLD